MSNLSANESNVDLLRFFKALADETRLKMAALLASKPRSGEQLAELLSIKAATVSHHLSKLADAELVTSTSEGHKKFYTLRLDAVRATAQQLQAKDPGLLVPAGGDTTEIYPNRVLYDEYDRKVFKDFFNSDGSLRQLPMQRKKFGAVLKHIVQEIEPGREYTEKQINALLKRRALRTKLSLVPDLCRMYDLSMKERKKQKFEPFKVVLNGRTFWQVNLESEYRTREDGTRVRVRPRRTFSNAEEARTFSQLKRVERTNHGAMGVSMDEKLRGDALEARRILEPFGVTVLDAAKEYAKRQELITKSETVSRAITSLLDAKRADNLRPRYLKDLRVRLARFALAFGERKLADITPAEIDQWLRTLSLSPLGRNTFRSRLSVLFEYGRACGWTNTNPVAEVRKVKVNETLPGILTPEQAARLLEASDVDTLPYWAIGLFCGLRTAELERLSWEDIHFEENVVEVPSLASKTASRRFVPIRPNLSQWLEPYKAMRGPLCPTNLRVRLETDRKNAGLAAWPSNGLRHSFGSYHLQQFQNAGQTALEMGHTRAEVTFRHYNQRVRPAAAEKFWKIAPLIQSERILKVVA